ncbi:MAG: hypothetical protein ACI81V_001092 [Lentimonas sp.]|jgi:uncharacterized protein (DUF983 family)
MNEQRKQAIYRPIRNRCPKCGEGSIMQSPARLHKNCPECGFAYYRENGFFSGALPINYALVIILWLIPVTLTWILGGISGTTAAVLCGIGAVIFPIALYRYSQCLWLAMYYGIIVDDLDSDKR